MTLRQRQAVALRDERTRDYASRAKPVGIDGGRRIFDAQARKHFNCSGDEWVMLYREGYLDKDDHDVVHLAMLLPLIEN